MVQTIESIRKRLLEPLPGLDAQLKLVPESRPKINYDKNKIDAAVTLFLFPEKNSEPGIVFIKRATYNGHHSGQISFPGGKFEKNDATFMNTAIRETSEELGIPETTIKIIGNLTDLYIPISKFHVHPFVAFTERKPEFNIDASEVDYLIFCTLSYLKQIEISHTMQQFDGKEYNIPFYKIENEMVWGATAMILSEFIDVLKSS